MTSFTRKTTETRAAPLRRHLRHLAACLRNTACFSADSTVYRRSVQTSLRSTSVVTVEVGVTSILKDDWHYRWGPQDLIAGSIARDPSIRKIKKLWNRTEANGTVHWKAWCHKTWGANMTSKEDQFDNWCCSSNAGSAGHDWECEGNQQENQSTRIPGFGVFRLVVAFNSERWIMRRLDEHRLQVFEMAVLRKISGISLGTVIETRNQVCIGDRVGYRGN